MLRRFALVLLALSFAACGTSFSGDAHFPGGPRVCYAKCAKSNMEMAAFIYAGEFATACVCEPRRRSRDETSRARTDAEISALVGAWTAMKARQAAVAGAAGGAVGGAVTGIDY